MLVCRNREASYWATHTHSKEVLIYLFTYYKTTAIESEMLRQRADCKDYYIIFCICAVNHH